MIKPMPDSIEEVFENPNAYGVPTFEQFRANKRRWLGSKEDILESVDAGDPVLGLRHKYFVEGRQAESLAHAERMARDMGFNLEKNFVLDIQIVPDGEKNITEVRFKKKRELEARAED